MRCQREYFIAKNANKVYVSFINIYMCMDERLFKYYNNNIIFNKSLNDWIFTVLQYHVANKKFYDFILRSYTDALLTPDIIKYIIIVVVQLLP